MVALRVVSVLLLLHVTGVRASTLYQWIVDSQTIFNYDPDPTNRLGVYNWPRTYSESCGGEHQSPVDIQTDRVRYGALCQCPQMLYRNTRMKGKLENNGHSPTFEPESPMLFQLTNVPYRSGKYYLHDFHLHYGGVRGRDFELQGRRFRGSGIMSAGSEHTIDGLRFEGELHFVFFNGKYMDLEEADSKSDGVVVFVILIQKIPDSMVDNGETSRFSGLLEETIPRIRAYQSNASIEVDMSIFFNRDCEFYTYPGSTTTPTCHESVRWLILRDPIRVTERAWFLLTQLQSRGDFNSRFGNYRTTQPLNDRIVEANFRRELGVIRPRPNGPPSAGTPNNVTSSGLNQPMTVSGGNNAIPNLNGNIRNPPMVISMQSALAMMQERGLRPNLNRNPGNILTSLGVSSDNAMFRPAPAAIPSPSAAMNNNDNTNSINTMPSISRPPLITVQASAANGNNNDNTNLINNMIALSRAPPAAMQPSVPNRNNDNNNNQLNNIPAAIYRNQNTVGVSQIGQPMSVSSMVQDGGRPQRQHMMKRPSMAANLYNYRKQQMRKKLIILYWKQRYWVKRMM